MTHSIRLCGVERVCEKCERAMLAQLETQCRPQVGYTARTLRKVPWRILSRWATVITTVVNLRISRKTTEFSSTFRNWGKIAHTELPHWVNGKCDNAYISQFR